jgi:hypothetical protein
MSEEMHVLNNDIHNEEQVTKQTGCGAIILLLFAVIWGISTAVIATVFHWGFEQVIIEGFSPEFDPRWVSIVGLGLLIFIPFLILSVLNKNSRHYSFYRAMMFAGALVLFLAPSRSVDIVQTQLGTIIQIIGFGVYGIGLSILTKPNEKGVMTNSSAVWISFLVGILISIPWILWGAFGSLLDIFINVGYAAVFGWVGSMILQVFLPEKYTPEDLKTGKLVMNGGLLSAILFVLVGGMGQHGNQWIILVLLSATGLLIAGIDSLRGESQKSSTRFAIGLLLAFSALLPNLFFDADELAIVIAPQAGEVISWANRTVWLSAGILMVATLVFYLRRRLITLSNGFRVATIGGVIVLGLIYFGFGQPGFYGEQLFVILDEQIDAKMACQMEDHLLRRVCVYETLAENAENSQADLRAALERYRISYTPYYLVNGLEVRGGPLVKLWLERRPEVDRVLMNPVLRPLPHVLAATEGMVSPPDELLWNQKLIHADQVWEMGYTGQGVIVGQSDSGVDGQHQELADSYLGRDSENNFHWLDPWYGTTSPTDIGGHGTHTLSSILGNSVGIAPDSEWIGCVNLGRNLGNPARYLDCMQFMLAPYPQNGDPFLEGTPKVGANVMNNSWGCPDIEGCDASVFQPAVSALRQAGIFMVVSAGNTGYYGCGSVDAPPAIYDEVYTVGAIDNSGELAFFSSIGPVEADGSLRVKPDVLAPGDGVLSAFPNGTYEIASGTSMAGPHVVGVVALMWSANPDLIGEVDLTEDILNRTTINYEGRIPVCSDGSIVPNNVTGFGIVDAYAAVNEALVSQQK